MKVLIKFVQNVREAFQSPNLPMDLDYTYLARRLEAERIRNASLFRLQ